MLIDFSHKLEKLSYQLSFISAWDLINKFESFFHQAKRDHF